MRGGLRDSLGSHYFVGEKDKDRFSVILLRNLERLRTWTGERGGFCKYETSMVNHHEQHQEIGKKPPWAQRGHLC